MPATGSGPNVFGFAVAFMALMGLMLLTLGLLARRTSRVRQ
jgi:hypothetical protein